MRIIEWDAFVKEGLPVACSKAADMAADRVAGNAAKRAAMAVGIFDGVHRGHKVLIEKIVSRKEMLPVIITFRSVLKAGAGKKYPGDILSFRQKTEIFESMGVAVTVAADLTGSFKRMSGEEFLAILRGCGNMGFMAVGSNFRCGHNQDTDADKIVRINTRENIQTEITEVIAEEGVPISSSRIRSAIANGKLLEAEAMLGRPYCLDLKDLAAAPADSFGGLVYDMGAEHPASSRVLPPSGTFTVMLHTKNGKEKAVIQIEKRYIRVLQLQKSEPVTSCLF